MNPYCRILGRKPSKPLFFVHTRTRYHQNALLSPNVLSPQHAIASTFITVATPQRFLLTASYIAFLESLFLYFLFHRNLLVFLGLYLPVIVDPAPHRMILFWLFTNMILRNSKICRPISSRNMNSMIRESLIDF